MNVVVNIATILAVLSLGRQSCEALAFQDFADKYSATTTAEQRCEVTSDCSNLDKICHENKCICSKEKPIEDQDQDRCLPQALLGELCSLQAQCLAESLCIGGTCACGIKAISVYNPSTRIFYCQPRRGLNEKCNSDAQCPQNAFCSERGGCLCLNGYSPANVSNYDSETTECLPKKCSSGSDCEEYHLCDDNKCKCLATHYDIDRAKCYKYKVDQLSSNELDQQQDLSSSTTTDHHNNHRNKSSFGDDFISILKDLTSMTSDKSWLVLIIIIVLSLLLIILLLSLLRKHYLGYCWTAHKKEYEPNTAKQQAPKNGHFDKNSINNKSFRRRNGDLDDEDAGNDSSTEDRSNLVAPKKNQGDSVAVNLNGKQQQQQESDESQQLTSEQRRLNYHRQQGPLKTSTSTPV